MLGAVGLASAGTGGHGAAPLKKPRGGAEARDSRTFWSNLGAAQQNRTVLQSSYPDTATTWRAVGVVAATLGAGRTMTV